MINKYLVTHTPPNGSTTDLTSCINLQETEGIRSDADSFSISLKKLPQGISFNDGDNIKIYFASGEDVFILVMDGFLKQITVSEDLDKIVWNIQGQNRLEIFLNAPIPATFASSGTNNNSAKAIKTLINNTNFKWLSSKYKPTIIAALKSEGGYIDDTVSLSTFSIPGYYRQDTPVFQMIEELSSYAFTGNPSLGNFIFYLDSNNNFHWEPPSTITSETIKRGQWLSIKVEKILYDVINFAIIHAGFDFEGKPIKTYAFNNTGQTKGFRGKVFVEHQIAENMKKANSFDATHSFGAEDIDGNTDNGVFRNKVRAKAKSKGEEVVGTFGQPRFKVSMRMRGSVYFSKGQLYKIEYSGFFRDTQDVLTDSLNLRLRQITHTFTSKGWFTDLEFIQDEKTLYGSSV